MPTEVPVRDSYRLIETLLWTRAGGYWLLEEHLARLARSSAALGFLFNEGDVREALEVPMRGVPNARLQVRLLQAPDGRLEVTASPQEAGGTRVWRWHLPKSGSTLKTISCSTRPPFGRSMIGLVPRSVDRVCPMASTKCSS